MTAVGGWIEVTLRGGGKVEGELIAVEAKRRLFVLAGKRSEQRPWVAQSLVTVELRDLVEAELYAYEGDSFWLEGSVGMITTVTTIIGPVLWLSATMMGNGKLDKYRVFSYSPGGKSFFAGGGAARLAALAQWARFPQGMPAGFMRVPPRDPARSPLSPPAYSSPAAAVREGVPPPAGPRSR